MKETSTPGKKQQTKGADNSIQKPFVSDLDRTKYSSKTTRWTYTTPRSWPSRLETSGEVPNAELEMTTRFDLSTADTTTLKISVKPKGAPNSSNQNSIGSKSVVASGVKSSANGSGKPAANGSKTKVTGNTVAITKDTATTLTVTTSSPLPTTASSVSDTSTTTVVTPEEGQPSIGGILNSINKMVSNFMQRFSFG